MEMNESSRSSNPPPSNPPPRRLDPLIYGALDIYAQWQNEVNLISDPTFNNPYSLEDFLKYPIILLIDAAHLDASRRILSFNCTDGDEGGPSVLTLFINTELNEIDAILTEFDTFFFLIYDRSQSGLLLPPQAS